MSAQGIRLSTSARADTSHQLVTRLDRLPVDGINNDIARGYVPGAASFGSFGERDFAGAAVNEMIWSDGTYSVPPIAGVQLSISSTSADDSATGTGIRSIELHYLDSNLDEQIEIVVLNGLTPVLTQATNIRFVNLMHIQTFGTQSLAQGNIQGVSGGLTYASILTGSNVQISSARMVPRNKRLYVSGATAGAISGTSAARVLIRLVANAYNGLTFNDPVVFLPYGSIGVQDSTVVYQFPVPFGFGEGIIIGLRASCDKGCTVSGSLYGWLEDV